MAKLHSRKKGRSSSKKKASRVAPAWVKLTKEEVISLVEKMAKEGTPMSMIGKKLRDEHGVPSVKLVCGKSISQILIEAKLYPTFPQDLIDLIRKAVNMREHLKENGTDLHNKKKLIDVESKIRRLVRYYHKIKKLPKGWKYEPEKAVLLVR